MKNKKARALELEEFVDEIKKLESKLEV